MSDRSIEVRIIEIQYLGLGLFPLLTLIFHLKALCDTRDFANNSRSARALHDADKE